jgi:hypothetical protein
MPKSNENLIKLSSDKDNYINEWLVISKTKVSQSDIERRCIYCNQELKITWEKNDIRNRINGNAAIMGSDCIKKFNENNNIKLSNEKTQITENIITLFHEGIFNKILNLEEYVINVIFDYLRSRDKYITIDYLNKMISVYANNKIIFDELCKILESKIKQQKEEEERTIQLLLEKEEQERIRQKKEEEQEKIRQEKEEEQERIKSCLIREEQERKEIKKKQFILHIESNLASFSCHYNGCRVTAKKYYTTKDNPNNKICHFCYEKYIN